MNNGKADILKIAETWLKEGRKLALATVIKTWGSSPRPVGSQLITDKDGNFEGSVSGGCVEGVVIDKAQLVIDSGMPEILEFKVSNEEAWEVGLACGGTIKVLVNVLGNDRSNILQTLNKHRANDQAVLYCININNGDETLVYRDSSYEGSTISNECMITAVETLNNNHSKLYETSKNSYFLHTHKAPQHIIIIGATHIAQSLCYLGNQLGFKITLVDPRKGFSTGDRFPNHIVLNEWPDDYFKKITLTNNYAIVTLAHDPKIDDPALEIGIRSNAFYIGALGSTRTHSKRIKRLLERGFIEPEINRINSPLGLSINAKTPEEIALSALAEIVKNQRTREIG